MRERLSRILRRLHRGQRGMTGLETAIILIAFVTVASVLAYSVLSAGIFSAERGKAVVHQGLQSAQATVVIQGSVLGLSPNLTELEQIQFNLALTLPGEKVNMNSIVVNYFDDDVHSEDVTWSSTINGGSTERGAASVLEFDEQHVVTITMPAAANLVEYEAFNVQVLPPTGATLTISRTVPGGLAKVMDLK